MIRKKYAGVKIIVIILICIFCANLLSKPLLVYAVDKEETQESISTLKEKLMITNNEIANLFVKRNELEKGIGDLELETKERTGELQQLIKKSEELEIIIQKRAQAIQLQEPYDRLIQFKSNGINRTFSLLHLLEKIRKEDEEKAEEYASLIKKIEKEREELAQKENEYTSYQDELEHVLSELEIEKQNFQKELDANEELLEQIKRDEESATEANAANQEKILNNLEIKSPLDTNQDITEQAKKIVNYTKNYLGVPYVWGGTTPEGFDCSGLMQWVFGHNGVQIPRVSQAQQQFAEMILIEDLRPGDLVFWGSPAYHVGIYIGEGYYIHAPQPGDVVKVTHNSNYPFESAGRVLF